jgi:beta-alanine degradation protein BauB
MTSAALTSSPFSGADWTPDIQAELVANERNGRVGSVLVSQDERVRVWHLSIAPGERLPFHRHVNDYFWTVLTSGSAKSRYGDGSVSQVSYQPGDTKHYRFALGESMFHDLENTGSTTLLFVTVELLGAPNAPLPVT